MEQIEAIDLCVPIYLNQKVVFDLLAMLEDGFSQLQNVKTSTLDSSAQTDSYGGSMGVSELVAFLKVSMRADKSKEKNTQAQQEATAEKVHTPNSLFFKLRTLLDNESLIKRIKTVEDVEQLKTGQIVEFKTLLRKNPRLDYLETLKNLIDLMMSIVNQQNRTKQSKQSSKKSSGETTPSRVQDVPGYKEMEEVKNSLEQSKSLEVIGDILDVQTAKVVLSTKREYFDDGDPSVMVDGEFYVIGKVVRVVDTNSGQSINLLRKTAFVGLNTAELFEKIGDKAISQSEGRLNLPVLTTEIYGPAIQMIPIAIFV